MKKGLLRKLMQISLTVLFAVRPFSVYAEEAEPETEETFEQEITEGEVTEEPIGEDDPEEPVTTEEETETEEVFIDSAQPEEAEEEETEEAIRESITEVNEVYEDLITEEDISVSSKRKGLQASASETYTDPVTLGGLVKEDIKARRTPVSYEIEITLQYDDSSHFDDEGFNSTALEKLTDQIMDAAMVHTGVSNEGDYFKYEYGGYVSNMNGKIRKNRTKNTVTMIGTLKLTFGYYSSAAQEAETADLVRQALEELKIDDQTDIEKIKRIAQYICSTTTYDYEHLKDESYKLKYTAYAAIHDHTAVCQGYAVLFYRMALESGLEARVFSGKAGNELHAWNIVKIKDKYYLLDCTWDAGRDISSFTWFLKCPASFPNHTTGTDDYNQRVLAECEITDTDYVPVTGFTMSSSSLVLNDKDDAFSFDAEIEPENATVKDIMWKSSDEQTAVIENGTLLIKGYGETEILIVTADGYYSGKLQIKVGEKKTLTVNNGSGSGSYYPERAAEVTADEPAEGEQFAYWDTDLEPAEGYSVYDSAAQFLMAESDAEMTAVYEDIPAEKVVPEFTEGEMQLDTEGTFNVKILPEEAVKVHPVWSSSDSDIISVTEDGTLKALDFGTAVITIRSSDGKASADVKLTVWSDPGFIEDEKGFRFRDKYGEYAVNQWVEAEGDWYYLGSDSYLYKGWLKQSGIWYWLDQDGRMAVGWRKIKGKYYYFNDSGKMMTGWLKDGNVWYYLNDSGERYYGWKLLSGKWYYMDPATGIMAVGITKVGNKKYYMHASGAMARGWEKVGGKWYFLDRSSGAMRTGWLKDGGVWYWLDSKGAMVTGWKQISGTWYYFSGSGAMQSSRWIGNYYVTESGAMAVSTWIGRYHVDSTGKWDATR